jgi:L,D-peptidoglycan transpeptidase YkuD (ErfK/YbiS/YcfS/YnhG family)
MSRFRMTCCRLLIVGLLLAVTGCRQLPSQQWEELQSIRKELLKQETERYLSDKYRDFDNRFEQFRLRYSRQASTSSLFREVEELERTLVALQMEGRVLAAETVERRQKLQADQREQIHWIEESLASLREVTFSRSLREASSEAQLKVAQARAFWEQGDYLRVESLMAEAQAQNDSLLAEMERARLRYRDATVIRQWRAWHDETVAWSRKNQALALVVDKYNRKAMLFGSGKLIKKYPADLGWNRLKDKNRQGDGATPEGKYKVEAKKGAGQTRYFRALLLDYPSPSDWVTFRKGKQEGWIEAGAHIGGLIEVHGRGGQGRDWTEGCIALEDEDMAGLFQVAYVGMPVTIVGELVE